MSGHAIAIANNDIVHIGWSFDQKIPGCTGFSIWRLPANGQGDGEPLRSLPTFVSNSSGGKNAGAPAAPDPKAPPALIRGFKWRDLLRRDQRGGTFRYQIFAMQGTDEKPVKMKDVPPLMTLPVTSTPHLRGVDAYFNRGILSTQALTHALQKAGGLSVKHLQDAIKDPNGEIRRNLEGQLQEGLLTLLAQREKDGGECYASLYELTDQTLIDALVKAGKKLHIVLSNNTGDAKKAYDTGNKPARDALEGSGCELISRYLPDGRSIGHNKFMVWVDKAGRPQAVLGGSTNWTASGLCTQSNNCLIAHSPELAQHYVDYWHHLKDDTEAAGIPATPKPVSALQGATLRGQDAAKPLEFALPGGGATIKMWPSPNTPTLIPAAKKGDTTPPPTPPDMAELFELIGNAKQAVLLLVFQPGAAGSARSWTVVKQLAQVSRQKPGLFVRGAISDEAEALEFEAQRNNRMDAEMVAPAGIVKKGEAWLAEIYKAGHAIVHNKVVVIDPFSDDCVVVTGSHNLGFKASYNNDENLVIVKGHRPLAEAYAAHCADVFEHHRWRWYQRRDAERAAAAAWVKDGSNAKTAGDDKYDTANFYKVVDPRKITGDSWQDRYFQATSLAGMERQFWAGGGQPLPPRAASPGAGMTSGLTDAEKAFRAARAALRKEKKKGKSLGTDTFGNEIVEASDGKKKPAAKKKAAKKKVAKKKVAKKKAAKKKKG